MRESKASGPLKSPLLEQTRGLMRAKHMSIRTESAYLGWIERFIRFHRDKAGRWGHPAEMGNDEINAFLTRLAVADNVAASTQNQAFAALLFLFREVLKKDFQVSAVRAKRPDRLPNVLSVDEVRRLLEQLPSGVNTPTTFKSAPAGGGCPTLRPKNTPRQGDPSSGSTCFPPEP